VAKTLDTLEAAEIKLLNSRFDRLWRAVVNDDEFDPVVCLVFDCLDCIL
jgi:hypothetical protein